jgi:PKD repeat protein
MASSNITTFIADNTPPTINLAVSPSTGGAALEFAFGSNVWKFNFTASGSHGHLSNVSAYFWDFGDGTNSTDIAVTHEYRQPGTYNVTLKVTDLAGNTATQAKTITINSAPGSLPSLGLVAAIVIPVVWALALAFYVIRFRRKTKKV